MFNQPVEKRGVVQLSSLSERDEQSNPRDYWHPAMGKEKADCLARQPAKGTPETTYFFLYG